MSSSGHLDSPASVRTQKGKGRESFSPDTNGLRLLPQPNGPQLSHGSQSPNRPGVTGINRQEWLENIDDMIKRIEADQQESKDAYLRDNTRTREGMADRTLV